MTNNVSYTIAMNIYRALGGQLSGFESVEDVYSAIDEIYSAGGGRIVVEPLNTTIKGGGKYIFNDNEITGYKPVEINVDVKEGFNFGVIGYDEELSDICNAPMAEKLSYSKSLYDAWDKNNTSAYKLYSNDNKIYYPPCIDTSNVTNMESMFYSCYNIQILPKYNTSKVTTMYKFLEECVSLKEVPLLDTSNVTDMSSMFYNCRQLTTIPQFDTSKVTRITGIFMQCSSLKEVPLLDTSNVTDMTSMFYNCSQLTTIPQFDTSKVTMMYQMFYNCSRLKEIPLLDCSNVYNLGYFLSYNVTSLTTLGGFKNLGMRSNLTNGNTNNNYFLGTCPNLTYESAMNVINNLYDRANAGYSVLTLKLHANVLALLSEDDIAIATNKGWTLT